MGRSVWKLCKVKIDHIKDGLYVDHLVDSMMQVTQIEQQLESHLMQIFRYVASPANNVVLLFQDVNTLQQC